MPNNSVRVGGAHITFDAETAPYARGIGRVRSLNVQAGASFEQLAVLGDRFSQSLRASIIATAAYAAGIGLIRNLTAGSAQAFLDLESGLIGVSKTANLSATETERLGAGISRLTTEVSFLGGALPVPRQNLLDIAEVAGQMNIKGVPDILAFTEAVGTLTLTTDLAGEEAANAFGIILQNTGTAAERSLELASALTALGNAFRGGESDILRTANEVARATASFDLAAGDILSLSAVLAAAGVRFEQAGTVIQRTLGGIQTAVTLAQAGDFNRLEGILAPAVDDVRNLRDEMEGFIGLVNEGTQESRFAGLRRVLDSLRAAGPSGQRAVLTSLVGGEEAPVRVANVLGILAKRMDDLDRATNLANQELVVQAAIYEEAGRFAASYGARLQVVQNQILEQSTAIGGVLIPVLTTLGENFRVIEVIGAGLGAAFASRTVVRGIERYRERLADLGRAATEAARSDRMAAREVRRLGAVYGEQNQRRLEVRDGIRRERVLREQLTGVTQRQALAQADLAGRQNRTLVSDTFVRSRQRLEVATRNLAVAQQQLNRVDERYNVLLERARRRSGGRFFRVSGTELEQVRNERDRLRRSVASRQGVVTQAETGFGREQAEQERQIALSRRRLARTTRQVTALEQELGRVSAQRAAFLTQYGGRSRSYRNALRSERALQRQLTRATNNQAAAAANLTQIQGRLGTGLTRTQRIVRGLSGTLAAIGGVPGLIVTGLTVATTAWALFGSAGNEALDELDENAKELLETLRRAREEEGLSLVGARSLVLERRYNQLLEERQTLQDRLAQTQPRFRAPIQRELGDVDQQLAELQQGIDQLGRGEIDLQLTARQQQIRVLRTELNNLDQEIAVRERRTFRGPGDSPQRQQNQARIDALREQREATAVYIQGLREQEAVATEEQNRQRDRAQEARESVNREALIAASEIARFYETTLASQTDRATRGMVQFSLEVAGATTEYARLEAAVRRAFQVEQDRRAEALAAAQASLDATTAERDAQQDLVNSGLLEIKSKEREEADKLLLNLEKQVAAQERAVETAQAAVDAANQRLRIEDETLTRIRAAAALQRGADQAQQLQQAQRSQVSPISDVQAAGSVRDEIRAIEELAIVSERELEFRERRIGLTETEAAVLERQQQAAGRVARLREGTQRELLDAQQQQLLVSRQIAVAREDIDSGDDDEAPARLRALEQEFQRIDAVIVSLLDYQRALDSLNPELESARMRLETANAALERQAADFAEAERALREYHNALERGRTELEEFRAASAVAFEPRRDLADAQNELRDRLVLLREEADQRRAIADLGEVDAAGGRARFAVLNDVTRERLQLGRELEQAETELTDVTEARLRAQDAVDQATDSSAEAARSQLNALVRQEATLQNQIRALRDSLAVYGASDPVIRGYVAAIENEARVAAQEAQATRMRTAAIVEYNRVLDQTVQFQRDLADARVVPARDAVDDPLLARQQEAARLERDLLQRQVTPADTVGAARQQAVAEELNRQEDERIRLRTDLSRVTEELGTAEALLVAHLEDATRETGRDAEVSQELAISTQRTVTELRAQRDELTGLLRTLGATNPALADLAQRFGDVAARSAEFGEQQTEVRRALDRLAEARQPVQAEPDTGAADLLAGLRERTLVQERAGRQARELAAASQQEAAGLRLAQEANNAYSDALAAATRRRAEAEIRLEGLQERRVELQLEAVRADRGGIAAVVERLAQVEREIRATEAEANASAQLQERLRGLREEYERLVGALQEAGAASFISPLEALRIQAERLDGVLASARGGIGEFSASFVDHFSGPIASSIDQFSSGLAEGLVQANLNFSELIENMLQGIAQAILRAIILRSVFAGLGALGLPGLGVGVGHTGGIGSHLPGFRRFDLAHSGKHPLQGFPQAQYRNVKSPLRARERFAIILDDEEVITRRDPRHRWNFGATNYKEMESWVSRLPRYHGGGVGGSGSAPAQRGGNNTNPPVTVNLHNEGTPQEVTETRASVTPEGIVLDVFTKHLSRKGPLTQVVREMARG